MAADSEHVLASSSCTVFWRCQSTKESWHQKQNKKKKNRQIPKSISGLGHSAWWFFEGGEQFTRLWLHFCWESNKEKQRSYERKGIQVSKRNRTTIGFTNGKNEDDSSTIAKGARVTVLLSIINHQPRQQHPGNWSQEGLKNTRWKKSEMGKTREKWDEKGFKEFECETSWVRSLDKDKEQTDRENRNMKNKSLWLGEWGEVLCTKCTLCLVREFK